MKKSERVAMGYTNTDQTSIDLILLAEDNSVNAEITMNIDMARIVADTLARLVEEAGTSNESIQD